MLWLVATPNVRALASKGFPRMFAARFVEV
jgi:hypothetical protein